MIAARFRLVGWVAGCAGAALCCYMASQSVAGERSALARVDGEIADTKSDIGRLETEVTARSRAGQIERWNGVLALQAARPAQYVSGGIQLASLAGDRRLPLDPAIVASHGAVDVVSYRPAPQAAPAPAPVVDVAPPPVVQQPLLRQATYVRPKPSRLGDEAAPPIMKASLEKPAPLKVALDLPAPKPKPKTAKAKPEGGLLPDDLGTLIAAERRTKPTKSAL